MKNLKLTIELVPKTSFCSNLRTTLLKKVWNKLRQKCYKKANYQCEICGGKGSKHPVECHEIWHYDEENFIQRLDGLIALCPACHQVKHIGLTLIRQIGYYENVFEHFCNINGIFESQALQYIKECFNKWRERSLYTWTLDTSLVESLLNE